MAFAAVWIDSESGGTIQAHFIQQEAFDSRLCERSNDGAMGRPVLIK